MTPPDAFHAHLDACRQCAEHPFALCALGADLLRAAAAAPVGIHFGVTPATRAEVRRLMGTDPVAELGFDEFTPEPGENAIVVVVRVPAAHTANAHIERCADCNHRVWVAATTTPGLSRVCTTCVPKRLARARSQMDRGGTGCPH